MRSCGEVRHRPLEGGWTVRREGEGCRVVEEQVNLCL
jgi:hypothetical protein